MLRWRAVVTPAWLALRREWTQGALVALLGAGGLAAVLPVLILQPGLAPVPDAGTDVVWSDAARTVDGLRRLALTDAAGLLRVVAWVTLGAAAAAILGRTLIHIRKRAPEFGIHRAVGAGRRAIGVALALEALVVLAAGLLVGVTATRLLATRAAAAWPGPLEPGAHLPWRPVLVITAVVLAGWLSALRFVRRRHMVHPADAAVRLWVPTTQLALAVAILTGAVLMLERGRELTAAQKEAGTAGMIVALDTGRLAVPERAARYTALLEHLAADQRVEIASVTHPRGFLGLGTVDGIMTDCGACVGTGGVVVPWHTLDAVHHFASPDTFTARGMEIVEGRGFQREDDVRGAPVVVVNRQLAARHFQGGRAVGRGLWLRTGFWRRPYTVIGVVDDTPATVLGGARQPREALWLATLQHPPAHAELLVRPTPEADALARTLPEALTETLGAGAVRGVTSEIAVLATESRIVRWFGAGFLLAGIATLLIAVIGVFGTTAAWVRSLGFELALRRAVGATRLRLSLAVLGRVTAMAAGGVLLGVIGYLVLLRGALLLAVPDLPPLAPGLLLPLVGSLTAVALLAAAGALVRELIPSPVVRLQ